jgi:phage/plasmid-like protein (TIGR03299 family)
MAHELAARADGSAAMFSVGRTPWHRLGAVLETVPSIAEALELSGAGFHVERRRLFFEAGVSGGLAGIVGAWATVRADTGQFLGIVGKDYTPLQNQEAFDVLRPLLDAEQATLETGGVLRDGADVWILARFALPADLADHPFLKLETIEPFFLLANNHAGRRGVLCSLTPIRVVCANTLSMAERHASSPLARAFLVSHRARVRQRTEEAAQHLYRSVTRRLQVAVEQYEQLRCTTLSRLEWNNLLLHRLAPLPKPPASKRVSALYDRHLTLALARRERLEHLWTSGPGHVGDHSAWEAYQAVTHSIDHDEHLWGRSAGPSQRLASLFDGHLSHLKNSALDRLFTYVLDPSRN